MDDNSDFSEYPEKSLLGPDGKLLPDVKDAWIKALESGKYRRKVNNLFSHVSPDGTKHMCCLGVLRDVVSPECSTPHNYPTRKQKMYYFSKHNFDLNWDDFYVNHERRLAEINDSIYTRGYSKQIKYIKENL